MLICCYAPPDASRAWQVGQQAASGEWDPVQLGLGAGGLLVTVVLTRKIGRVVQAALDGAKARAS